MNIFLSIFLFLIPIFLLLTKGRRSSKRVPPGSLGIPFLGQSLSFLRAMRANTAEKWLEERIRKYGPISKLSLFGKLTVFISGQAANKFVFTSDSGTISYQQNQSLKMILGDRNIFELSGEDHKRIRSALLSFLKPESLKQYVRKMDAEVKEHLEMHWQGKQQVEVLPLMKTLTFNIICSLLFGVEQGARRDKFVACFQEILVGMWAVPVNLSFTRYNRGLKASAMVQNMVKDLIIEKRVELEQKGASPHQDLITCLLSIRKEDNEEALTENEIVHNVMLVMVAGHDTSSVLMTFIMRLLANEPAVYAAVLQVGDLACLQLFIQRRSLVVQINSDNCKIWENLVTMKKAKQIRENGLRELIKWFGFVILCSNKNDEWDAHYFVEHEEIAKTKPLGEFLTWEDLTKMKYTWRVAMETLRMVPPVFGGFRKALKDIEYGGYLIPKGWQIFWTTPMTHMDNSIFQEPSKFDPSRFENQASVPPYSFIAFGGGPRICPGYEFARIKTLVTIHYLVTQFTWKLCSGNSFSRDPIPIPTQGLPIKLVPRKLC